MEIKQLRFEDVRLKEGTVKYAERVAPVRKVRAQTKPKIEKTY